jgi:hypothetical protein
MTRPIELPWLLSLQYIKAPKSSGLLKISVCAVLCRHVLLDQLARKNSEGLKNLDLKSRDRSHGLSCTGDDPCSWCVTGVSDACRTNTARTGKTPWNRNIALPTTPLQPVKCIPQAKARLMLYSSRRWWDTTTRGRMGKEFAKEPGNDDSELLVWRSSP